VSAPHLTTPPPIAGRAPRHDELYAYYVLAVLFVVYVFNFVDRQVLSILIQPIQDELHVSDTWMGLLAGPAFAFFYTLAGVPIARWADTGSRRSVLVFSLSLWSLMTAASGLARSFATLALARIGVGVGEAGGTPPSHSLLSDYFPPERRATALALYGNGIYVGSGLGILAGGLLERYFGDWRTAFFVVGLAGLPLAALVWLTVRDVARGRSDDRPLPTTGGDETFFEVMRFLFTRRSFCWLVTGACLKAIAGYAVLTWGAIFLGRVHGMDRAAIGALFGPTIMVGGCLGVTFGGWLADRLGRADPRWYMRMPAVVSVLALPLALGFALAEDRRTAIACFVPFYALANMYVGPLWSTAQNLARPNMRATASAVLLFVINIIGLAVGPAVTGAMSDALEPRFGDDSLRYALLLVSLTLAWSAFHFQRAGRTLVADLEVARDASRREAAGEPL
jgi:predicted MFS family arabinose efflux permease